MNRYKLLRSEVIRIKLTNIAESIDLVRSHLPSDVTDFLTLGLLKDGIYKRVEYAIEDILDICAIINADLKLGMPQSEDDIISSLVRNHLLEPSIGEEIRQMKRFRNIVVHQYGKIDDVIAYEILTTHLLSFDRFQEWVNQVLNDME